MCYPSGTQQKKNSDNFQFFFLKFGDQKTRKTHFVLLFSKYFISPILPKIKPVLYILHIPSLDFRTSSRRFSLLSRKNRRVRARYMFRVQGCQKNLKNNFKVLTHDQNPKKKTLGPSLTLNRAGVSKKFRNVGPYFSKAHCLGCCLLFCTQLRVFFWADVENFSNWQKGQKKKRGFFGFSSCQTSK